MERIFQAGGILLIIGAVLPIFLSADNFIYAAVVYTFGAVPFSIMQFRQHYTGKNITIKRLRRQQVTGAMLLLLTAVFMFTEWFHLRPFTGDFWKVSLTIAAFFEVYSTFRLSAVRDDQ